MAFLGWACILTAFIIMSAFLANPWRLDMRKLRTAQWMFWLGLLALTYAACIACVTYSLSLGGT